MFIQTTFKNLMPSLFTAAGVLFILWLILWLGTRGIRKMASWMEERERERVAEIEAWANQLIRFLRRSVEVVSVLTATFITLRGVGFGAIPGLTWQEVTRWLFSPGMHILLVLVGAFVLNRLLRLVANQLPALLVPQEGTLTEISERAKRTETIVRMARRTITAVVTAAAILISLRQLGVNITPILTGAGIVGLAVGFGAQHLVRDVISGFFLITENQVRVGDVAVINGKGGLVEAIRLRTIILRGLDGTVHVIPNGAISELSNMTKDFSYYLIDLGVAYKEDIDHVIAVLRQVADDLQADPDYSAFILEPLEILGVNDFADSAVVVRARIKTVPIKQWTVGRELRRRIKKTFDSKGIEIPYPHVSVYFGEASKPFAVQTAEALRGSQPS